MLVFSELLSFIMFFHILYVYVFKCFTLVTENTFWIVLVFGILGILILLCFVW